MASESSVREDQAEKQDDVQANAGGCCGGSAQASTQETLPLATGCCGGESVKSDEDVRASVSRSYAKAVTREKPSCCGEAAPKGSIVTLAGYEQESLAELPAEAVVNSFGCGNPVAFSGVKEGDTVLDLGSGAGIDLLIAAKKVGPKGRAIGVDMTDEMLAKAQENIAAAGLSNVEVRKGIIEELPVEDGTVDWVISNCVINLSPNKPQVFREIARVLKPGGQMLVSDVVAEGLPPWVREHEALHAHCVGGAISEAEYVAGLEAAGLGDVEIRERIHYSTSQIKAFFVSDLLDADEQLAAWVESLDEATMDEMAESVEGRFWSALVYAKKREG